MTELLASQEEWSSKCQGRSGPCQLALLEQRSLPGTAVVWRGDTSHQLSQLSFLRDAWRRSGSVVGEVNDFIVLCEVVGVFPTGASGDVFVELQGRLEPTERVPDLVKFPAGMICLTKVTGLPKGTMLVCSLPLNLCPEVQWVQPLRVYRTHSYLKARVRRHVARQRS